MQTALTKPLAVSSAAREKRRLVRKGDIYIIEFEQFDSVWSVQPHSSTAAKEKVSDIYCSDSLA
jgi:hypothetical protein